AAAPLRAHELDVVDRAVGAQRSVEPGRAQAGVRVDARLVVGWRMQKPDACADRGEERRNPADAPPTSRRVFHASEHVARGCRSFHALTPRSRVEEMGMTRRRLLRRIASSPFVVAALAAFAASAAFAPPARADVRLAAVIGSHMVLQQQSDVALWGTADAGEEITVAPSWTKGVGTTKAGADG